MRTASAVEEAMRVKRFYKALAEANQRAQQYVRDTLDAPRTTAITTKDASILYAIACGAKDRSLLDKLSATAAPIGLEMMRE